MKTVAILSGKGGSGKSTIALHLAVAAERRGYSVAVLDIDPARLLGDMGRQVRL